MQPDEKKFSDTAPHVLVSVLSYNSAPSLLDTLRRLRHQTYTNYHLQLTDNGSTNDRLSEVRREFPELRVRVLDENSGYTGGSNAALTQGLAEDYDYVLLCTHDVEIDKRAIEYLVETAEERPEAGIIGGIEVRRHAGEEHLKTVGSAKFSRWTSRLKWLPPASTKEPTPTLYVHGALIMFTRRALAAGVRMDENLFMYFDEVDLGYKLKEFGLQAYVDPRVMVRHERHPTKCDPREGYLMQRNRAYIVRKHGNWYHRVFYNFYAALLELPAKIVLRTVQGHTAFARACVRGHLDGWRGRMGRDA